MSAGFLVGVECNPLGDPQQLLYFAYSSTKAMNNALAAYTHSTATQWGNPTLGNCQHSEGSIGYYTINGRTVGQLACPLSTDTPIQWGYLWTNWNTDILGVVNDGSYWSIPANYYQWWANYGGSTA